ncbi:oligosaccharide flippase family protein [Xylophilus rhododendri]|uniref:Oligosaccharide flippase family protein n=1 Tax=Xylophilus rhododendri TaxID=2697032 RepID=A0A857JBN0_9BURK|nr:oligosaccharide flippase family protein [Xylophilus rhododendri]QHJ00159.1 oligosaccharide flippase family protein [Xylophilus rhododendri]
MTQIFLMFATLKIGTSMLPPSEMAVVFMLTSAVAIVSALLINPVGMFMNRRMHAWHEAGSLTRYFHLFYVAVAMVGLLCLAAAAWGLPLYNGVHGRSVPMLAGLIAASLVTLSINSTAISGLNLLGRTREFLFLSAGTAALSLACAFGFASTFGKSAEHWFLGIIVGQAIVGMLAARSFPAIATPRKASPVLERRKVRSLFAFAWPISIAVGLASIQAQGYRLLGGNFIAMTDLGLVAAGVGVSVAIMSSVESILSSYLMPAFYRTIGASTPDAQMQAWAAYARVAIPIFVVTGCYLAIVAPELVGLFMGPAYADAGQYVYWGVIAEVCRVVAYTFAMVLHAKFKTRALIVPALCGAFTALATFLLLARPFQGLGVGISIAAASAAAAWATFLAVRKEIRNLLNVHLFWPVPLGAAGIYVTALGLKAESGHATMFSQILVVGICGLLYLAVLFAMGRRSIKNT